MDGMYAGFAGAKTGHRCPTFAGRRQRDLRVKRQAPTALAAALRPRVAVPKFGLTLSNRDVVTGESTLDELLWLARRADADPVWDSLWVGDSILAKPRLDSITLLGGLATATERVRLGPACMASTPLRPAIELAYQWASLDFLSGGRTIFVACQGQGQAGGGHFATEFAALGVAPKDRMRRMEEAIEILRLTSSAVDVDYEGVHNRFRGITIEPRRSLGAQNIPDGETLRPSVCPPHSVSRGEDE